MSSHTQTRERVSFQKRLGELVRSNQKAIGYILAAVAGYIFSGAIILERLSPFGVAFLAAVPFPFLLPGFLGAVLGYALSGSIQITMKYMASALLVTTVHWLWGKKNRKTPLFACVSAAGASLAITALIVVTGGGNVYQVILGGCEALLSAGACYFFIRSRQAIGRLKESAFMNPTELSSIAITVVLMLVSLCRIQVEGLSLGRCLAVLLVLLAAYAAREAGGSIAGVVAGLAMTLWDSSYVSLATGYSFGGLLAGVFAPFGRFGIACAFIIGNGIAAIVAGAQGETLMALAEVMVGAVVFMLIPGRLLKLLDTRTLRLEEEERGDGVKTAVTQKLRYAANTLRDLSKTVTKVTRKLDDISANDISTVFTKTTNQVCSKCGLKLFCHDTIYTDTMNAFNDFGGILRKKGHIERGDIPAYFQSRCAKLTPLVEKMNENYKLFRAAQSSDIRVRSMSGVLADQFDGVSNLLTELSSEIAEVERYDTVTALKVKDFFLHMGFYDTEVSCLVDQYGRLTMDITLKDAKVVNLNMVPLTEHLSEITGRILDLPGVCRAEEQLRLTFGEKATLSLQVGSCQIPHSKEAVCGDSYEVFYDGKGMGYLLISDGMGSGSLASIDAKIASNLFVRLIKGGFSYESTIKTVNSVMMLKSAEETLATLDVCCIDLFTGQAEFLKAGAAPSFLWKAGEVSEIEQSALPVGILSGVSFERSATKVQVGDMVVLVSDGVTDESTQWIKGEIKGLSDAPAQEIAEKLAQAAKARRSQGEDDITVLVAKLAPGIS